MKRLKIALVSSFTVNEFDFKLRSVFNDLFASLKSEFSDFLYSEIDFINFSFNDEPQLLAENCIATLNPIKYLVSKQVLEDKIQPLFAIKKIHQTDPYFPAFFIANKFSTVNSLRSKDIQTMYAVAPTSTSGFVTAAFKLWESGIIVTPNENGIKTKGWKLVYVGSHKEVEARVIEDKYSIGATGQFTNQDNPSKSPVKVILRYYYLPQDVLVISQNLMPYCDFIKSWFKQVFDSDFSEGSAARNFAESSTKITGVTEINDEFLNSMHELDLMNKCVQSYSNSIQKDVNNIKVSPENKLSFSSHLKKMIAEGKISNVINDLSNHFRESNDSDSLDEVIMQSSALSNLTRQNNSKLLLIGSEESNQQYALINKALLDLINRELKDI